MVTNYSSPLMDYMREACLKKLMVWSKNIITVFHIQDNKLFRDKGGERLCFLYDSSCGHMGRKCGDSITTLPLPHTHY